MILPFTRSRRSVCRKYSVSLARLDIARKRTSGAGAAVCECCNARSATKSPSRSQLRQSSTLPAITRASRPSSCMASGAGDPTRSSLLRLGPPVHPPASNGRPSHSPLSTRNPTPAFTPLACAVIDLLSRPTKPQVMPSRGWPSEQTGNWNHACLLANLGFRQRSLHGSITVSQIRQHHPSLQVPPRQFCVVPGPV